MTSLMPQGILMRTLFDVSNQTFQFSNKKQSQNNKQITNQNKKIKCKVSKLIIHQKVVKHQKIRQSN